MITCHCKELTHLNQVDSSTTTLWTGLFPTARCLVRFITNIDSPPVGRKRKAHELSDCEDITSDSDILMDSSSEEEVDVGKERREMTKKGDSMENKDSSAAGTLAEKGHVLSNMELLKAMGNEFDKVEALGPQVDETLASVVNSGIRNKIDRMVAKELCKKLIDPKTVLG